MIEGKVIWFDVKKGYGFIRRGDAGGDVFVHYSKIDAPAGEYRVLEAEESVEFEIFLADRGDGKTEPQAKSVRRIG